MEHSSASHCRYVRNIQSALQVKFGVALKFGLVNFSETARVSVKVVERKGFVVSLFTNLCMLFLCMEFNSTALYAWSLKPLYNLLIKIQTNTILMAGPCNSGSGNQIN